MPKATSEYNLGKLHPHLIDEFHPTLNEKTIFDYSPHSNQKVYWICEKHDHYLSSPANRLKVKGCSYCDGKKAHPKDNFKIHYSKLAEEFHPTLNNKKPEEYTKHSYKKVYWICKTKKWGVRHTWQASIESRTRLGSGCPFCAGLYPSSEHNFKTEYPNLVKEWYYEKNVKKPEEYTLHTKKKVWWKCPKSKLHSYQMEIDNRTSKAGSGCPFCAGKRICDDNNLAYKRPYILKQIHPTKNGNFDPYKTYYGSTKKIWWQCFRGHEWKADIWRRVNTGSDCPKCSGASVSRFEFRLLSELEVVLGKVEHRKVIDKMEMDIYLPYHRLGIEYDGWRYHKDKIERDKNKNKFFSKKNILIIRIREQSKTTLPKIKPVDVLHNRSEKDLDVIKRLLLSINKKIKLSKSRKRIVDRYLKSNDLWNDEKYYEYFDQLYKPPKKQSLEYTHPEHLKWWHPKKNKKLLPSEISYGTTIEVWWKCDKVDTHEWKTAPITRRGCPYCSNRRVTENNMLKTLYPELMKEVHPIKNSKKDVGEMYAYSPTKRVWWKCDKGEDHIWQSSLNGRIRKNGQTGERRITKCPYCINKFVSITNCLATTHPELAKEFHPTKNGDLTPKIIIGGQSGKYYWWRCNNNPNHEWKRTLQSRVTRKNTGCPLCRNKYKKPK